MLIVGMELADRSLWDRFIEAEDQGLRGIPRGELLGYLWDVASGIDHLNEPRHTLEGRPGVGVQHRDLKPQNILLFGGGAKVADFGEAQVMDGPVAPNNGTWTLSYAAPEFFDGIHLAPIRPVCPGRHLLPAPRGAAPVLRDRRDGHGGTPARHARPGRAPRGRAADPGAGPGEAARGPLARAARP